MATRFPLDFEALKKGDVIPFERIEKICGHSRGTDRYRLALLQLREQIKRSFEARGVVVAVQSDQASLRICLDSEASPYSSDRTHQHLRSAARAHRELLAVDVAALTQEEKPEHERRAIRDSQYMQALAQADCRVIAGSHRRRLPGLPSGGIPTPEA